MQHFDINKDYRRFTTVDVDGLGTVRIASFSARNAMELRKLLKRQTAGEDIDLPLTKLMLTSAIVNDDGKPVFDEAAADSFIDRVTPDIAAKIVTEVTKHQAAGTEAAVANPSSPSPSVG